MIGCYGIFPDGAVNPSAVFESLEDAMEWGLKRYGDDAFGIKYLEVARVERGDTQRASESA